LAHAQVEAGHAEGSAAPRSRTARWRAATLAGIYGLFLLHILHWRLAGRTLAPLEFNEVMYTLEIGVLTAGFVLMALAVVATAIFGRFFCSWGCHILALQDLCHWILTRLKLRPRPVRSRLLLLIPAVVALYMFAWPQLERIVAGQPAPALHLRTDAQGWGSFTTREFWRNLPGPGVTLATFAACGFAIVMLMGSRSFCFYGCPYGAVFSVMDRIAPGRIRARDHCRVCGECTAACTSGIRVHEEIGRYGMVVSDRCLRDLDCVAACPEKNLFFGFGKPSLLAQALDDRPLRRAYDFGWGEEIAMTAIFAVTLFAVRGLYDLVPFFLAIALGVMLAYASIVVWRLGRRTDVRLGIWRLKTAGAVTMQGRAAAACVAACFLLVAHSGLVRYHMAAGWSGYQRVAHERGVSLDEVDRALAHLGFVERHGLVTVPRLRAAEAELQYAVAGVLFGQGRPLEAAARLKEVVRLQPANAAALAELGALLSELGDLPGAIEHLRAAIRIEPQDAGAHHNLAVTLHQAGRTAEARAEIDAALRLAPDDPQSLGFRSLLESAGGGAGPADSVVSPEGTR